MLNQSEIAKRIAKKCGLDKKSATRLINLTFAVILDAAANGEPVRILGFGAFEVRSGRLRGPIVRRGAKGLRDVRMLKFLPFRATRNALNAPPTEWGKVRVRRYLDLHK